jgi:hypothetical protein
MIIDALPHEAASLTKLAQDLDSQRDMEDRSQFLQDRENSFATLDDETIVRRFARGKKRLVANQNLRINYAHNSLQLSTPNGELIAIHKIAERLHYILVKKDAKYSEMIQNLITEYQFMPIDTMTAERGFVRYQKYEIPEGYLLRYESAAQMWQMWQEHQHQLTVGFRLDVLILAKSKWYRIQDMICTDDRLDLQTRLGLISLSLRDRIAWISKLDAISTDSNSDRLQNTNHQNGNNPSTDSGILAKIISKLAITDTEDNSLEFLPHSDLDFDPHVMVVRPFLNQPHDSLLLYDSDRSSTLTANTLSPIKERLLTDTIKVLEDYLEHGETIVRTEVTTDAQGNVISEKTVTTHRGCPRWAIETILSWN